MLLFLLHYRYCINFVKKKLFVIDNTELFRISIRVNVFFLINCFYFGADSVIKNNIPGSLIIRHLLRFLTNKERKRKEWVICNKMNIFKKRRFFINLITNYSCGYIEETYFL